MAVITLPEGLPISRMSWNQQRMAMGFSSPFGSQTVEGSPPVWAVSVVFDRMMESESGLLKSVLLRLKGPTNQLALWDVARPVPVGTARGNWTLSGPHAQGATLLSLSAGPDQVGKTLVPGDWIGIGSGLQQQLVMVTIGGTASGSGILPVTVEAPLKYAFPSGTPLVWDKPKALFRMQNDRLGWDYEKAFASGFALDLLEDVRP